MAKLNLNSGAIQSFDVTLAQETKDGHTLDVVHMSITSETADVRYRVVSDTRHPDINIIHQDLDSGLNQAINSDFPFGINEYLERAYIFVTYPNGETAQYTATRIGI